ncbi:bifunctional 2-C-methyl-D-erythritol 4-phosphate cytidylyltransferase/2-C-methyl-D-erythritol 2,4-cyclodiphosphate synthase [Campylobacter sp. FMV-PI01]|uniref:Bifunctional enzyme IspD/IspF n=1 Tax=Campylobacter portucalensis TaxID=2608384 RepID=A0A6L5WKL3_9BACT|nr:bifunctional 2-C-methyl-D-erythritol 4-phosphate cytidylyltransferase/2-C-methyl-D-erythritol 2,4-cyclodiphosphate synthase [Campylobacter portucalensis]MSN96393.1 bifunctional 2-C-methyl-D-erythritol 4-phosphate cytidylyltransferase/2-C-methyl-D-erythritol 2,4-cyclodiphosphate synthase [Campylobacter portucalensis]
MLDIALILLAAGNSTRMELETKKQWLRTKHEPLWLYCAKNFKKMYKFKKIMIVANKNEIKFMRQICDDFEFVCGGDERQVSLQNALNLVDTEFVMVSDVVRVYVNKNVVLDMIENAFKFDSISPYIGVYDTTYLGLDAVNRDEIKLIQTPQLSKTKLLKKALKSGKKFTDDSMAIKSVGGSLGFIKGDKRAFKITTKDDLKMLNLQPPSSEIFTGNGFDVHKFQDGDGLILCGIKVPCEYKFIAHSDGDVAIHALIDAILGACMMGDIGELYPDTNDEFKGIDSKILLKNTLKLIKNLGYTLVNVDITIIAQTPKLQNYKHQMRQNLVEILGIERVNVKATTTEKLGFVGRSEGIAVMASASARYFDWMDV